MPTDVPNNAPSAFFSYCRADSDFALKLAEDLKNAGANVWIDQLDIEPGAPWDAAVEEALNKSPRMLVILSPVSVSSDNVRDEVSFALSRQKRVIPVLYRDCEVPFRLARLQHIDFRTDHSRGLKLLLKSLGVENQASPPVDEAAERARAEQAELDRKAAEEKARHEEIQRQLLVVEQERLEAAKRQSAAESARLEEERKRLAAEQARLDEERKQTAAERSRLEQLDRDRKAAEEKARQGQAERQAAAGRTRQEEAVRQRMAAEQVRPSTQPQAVAPPPVPAPSRFPAWGKPAAIAVGAVIVLWLIYVTQSPPKKPTAPNQSPETESSQTQAKNPPPASQPASSSEGNSTPSPSEPAKTTPERVVAKPKNPPQAATTSKPTSIDTSRAPTSNAAPSTLTTAASIPPGLSAEMEEKYRKAQAGDAGAMVDVGYAYNHAEGAPHDDRQAAYWYRKAAEAGNPAGMYDLGRNYHDGRGGLPHDETQALYWYRKAADAGDADGMVGVGIRYENGQGGLPHDEKQAVYWYRKAADAGNALGMAYLADMYENGKGVDRDYQQALNLYRKAAGLGNQYAKDALKRLGENP